MLPPYSYSPASAAPDIPSTSRLSTRGSFPHSTSAPVPASQSFSSGQLRLASRQMAGEIDPVVGEALLRAARIVSDLSNDVPRPDVVHNTPKPDMAHAQHPKPSVMPSRWSHSVYGQAVGARSSFDADHLFPSSTLHSTATHSKTKAASNPSRVQCLHTFGFVTDIR